MKPICLMLVPTFILSCAATDAGAQNWPAKPLRAVVPFAAGSSTDIVPRIVFERLSQQLGQTIVVENRTGAGGTIGAAFVAKSEPDGYTILVSGAAHTIAPALYPKLTYHPGRDFAAVVPLGISPNVLVVSPAKGFTTVGDLVAAAKARPGTFNFSSVGVGSATHLSAERFRSSAGINAIHVPFNGGAQAMSEVIAGRVDFFFGPPALVLPHVRAGKLAALVVNGTSRTPRFAGRSDDAGGWLQRRRIPDLVRTVCAGKDATRHRQQAAQRDGQSAAGTQGAGADRGAFRRSHGHDAERLRRVCPKGNRPQRSAGQSGRHQAGLRSGGVVAVAGPLRLAITDTAHSFDDSAAYERFVGSLGPCRRRCLP